MEIEKVGPPDAECYLIKEGGVELGHLCMDTKFYYPKDDYGGTWSRGYPADRLLVALVIALKEHAAKLE